MNESEKSFDELECLASDESEELTELLDEAGDESERGESESDEVMRELELLRRRLAESEEREKRSARGWRELCELYPDCDLSLVSESFEKAVAEGVPPAAAYALEMRRREIGRARIENANRRGREMSTGKIGNVNDSLYSPDEVRAMTPSEVRENYQKIRLSMKSWK